MSKTTEQEQDYDIGSGNVFADMGMDNPEERLLKSNLARMVNRTLKQRGWTQKHTAEVLGITQPKVSDMKRGPARAFFGGAVAELSCQARPPRDDFGAGQHG